MLVWNAYRDFQACIICFIESACVKLDKTLKFWRDMLRCLRKIDSDGTEIYFWIRFCAHEEKNSRNTNCTTPFPCLVRKWAFIFLKATFIFQFFSFNFRKVNLYVRFGQFNFIHLWFFIFILECSRTISVIIICFQNWSFKFQIKSL